MGVRIIRPPASDAKPSAVFVYIHGGGWIQGSVENIDQAARTISEQANAVVVSVKYRKHVCSKVFL